MSVLRSLALLLAGLATPAHAQGEPEPYAAPGPWTVAVDPTMGNGCFAHRIWQGGTGLRLGFMPAKGASHLILGNDGWDVSPGQAYDLVLAADGARFRFSARGVDLSSDAALAAGPLTEPFLGALARANRLDVVLDGQRVADLSLAGSARAIALMRACQRETTGEALLGGDPFS